MVPAAERARVEQAGEVVLAAGPGTPARAAASIFLRQEKRGSSVDRVVFDRPAGTQAELDAIAARNNLTVLATSTIASHRAHPSRRAYYERRFGS